jgi:CRP-like cAMP-binding protein
MKPASALDGEHRKRRRRNDAANTPVAREISLACPHPGGNFGRISEHSSRLRARQDKERSVMKTVGERAFASVDGRRIVSKYQKRQIVFSQGEVADAVFYIQSGKVKSTVVSQHGKEAVIAILGSGDFFGEGCLAGQSKRTATVAALTECVVVRIESAALIRILHEEPAFSETFISHLLARNIRIEEDFVDQLFNSSERRLARALLLLANFEKDARSESVTPRISHEMLAEMIGTTRARVTFFMNGFRKRGFISYKGKMLEVHSSLLSAVLTDHLQPGK